ncbi:DUF6270 domain-containing protein [Pseudactinotalea sp. Z1732]|uniref:DUF6270 domain-containing protein n=1 Tax=Micrococcales TaxID=85006 RepID=UPI003C7ACC7A
MPTTSHRTLLYGSCVSRDMYEYLRSDYMLKEYTARQSLISAAAPSLDLTEVPGLESAFQRRMVVSDFASSMRTTLPQQATDIDLLVLDLVDERLGVVRLGGGVYVTRSQELLDSKLLQHFPDASPMIPFGSNEHFALWLPAASAFIGLLRQTGLIERTLLIEATFASRTDVGTPANKWWNKPARHWNKAFARYYQVFKDAGVRTHVIGKDAISDSAHKWGPAAYHYVDQAYLGITRTIEQMVASSNSNSN